MFRNVLSNLSGTFLEISFNLFKEVTHVRGTVVDLFLNGLETKWKELFSLELSAEEKDVDRRTKQV